MNDSVGLLKEGGSVRWQAESGSGWHAMRIVGVCRGLPKFLMFVNSIYTVFKLLLQIGDVIIVYLPNYL